jgi:hypothetical protein
MTTRTRMSAADFDRFVLLPENADRRCEYIEGAVIEVVSQHISSAIGTYVGRRMTVFAPGARTLTDADLLDGGDLLPGWTLSLADVFAL